MNFLKESVPGSKAFNAASNVYLEASHICIKKEIAEKLFGAETVVFTVFYPKEKTLMLAPASEELFKTLHKATQQLLKNKNVSGDRSVAIQEIIMDNNIDDTNRNLEFVFEEALHTLKVSL